MNDQTPTIKLSLYTNLNGGNIVFLFWISMFNRTYKDIKKETMQLVYSQNENTHNGKCFTTTKVLHFWLSFMPHMSYILIFPGVIIEVMPVIISPDISCDVVSLCIWTLHIFNLQIAAGHRFIESRSVLLYEHFLTSLMVSAIEQMPVSWLTLTLQESFMQGGSHHLVRFLH